MYKYIVVIITTLVVFFTSLAFAEAPAPFAKAKEYAMASKVDATGNYILLYDVDNDMGHMTYIIGYLPKYKMIGVGIIRGMEMVVFQCDDDGKLSVFYNGTTIEPEPQKIIDAAFQIFRELVAAGAI